MKYLMYTLLGLGILFLGIRVGTSTATKNYFTEFEPLRHQNIASEIDLQIQLLKLMSEGKSADAKHMLQKWLELNICEMGAYKQSRYFIKNPDVVSSIYGAKKFFQSNGLPVSECSKKAFTAYSSL